MTQSSRLTIAAWIFSIACLLSSAHLLIRTGVHPVDSNYVAQRSDQRFSALKASLPTRGVIGYIGEPGASVSDYYLTQYALAPLVIDRSANHSLVVGNFPSSFPPNLAEQHLQVLRDFGNGVLLLTPEDHR